MGIGNQKWKEKLWKGQCLISSSMELGTKGCKHHDHNLGHEEEGKWNFSRQAKFLWVWTDWWDALCWEQHCGTSHQCCHSLSHVNFVRDEFWMGCWNCQCGTWLHLTWCCNLQHWSKDQVTIRTEFLINLCCFPQPFSFMWLILKNWLTWHWPVRNWLTYQKNYGIDFY